MDEITGRQTLYLISIFIVGLAVCSCGRSTELGFSNKTPPIDAGRPEDTSNNDTSTDTEDNLPDAAIPDGSVDAGDSGTDATDSGLYSPDGSVDGGGGDPIG